MLEIVFQGEFSYQPHRFTRGRNGSTCHLEVVQKNGVTLAIATELKDANQGMRITNSSEQLATSIVNLHKLKPANLIVVEHYNDKLSYGVTTGLQLKRHYDEPHDNWNLAQYRWMDSQAVAVTWKHLHGKTVKRLRELLHSGAYATAEALLQAALEPAPQQA